MNAPKRHLVVVLSVLCGCTPTACPTNLMPQCPIPEDSVRTPTPNSNTACQTHRAATGSNGMYHFERTRTFRGGCNSHHANAPRQLRLRERQLRRDELHLRPEYRSLIVTPLYRPFGGDTRSRNVSLCTVSGTKRRRSESPATREMKLQRVRTAASSSTILSNISFSCKERARHHDKSFIRVENYSEKTVPLDCIFSLQRQMY